MTVLIVPLWNWNNWCAIRQRFRPCVLIVPLWNWNRSLLQTCVLLLRFNRTFMELKLITITSSNRQTQVLIVPLWNWNNFSDKLKINFFSFNRTFMELKWQTVLMLTTRYGVLIVPLWNWNLTYFATYWGAAPF